MSIKFPFSIDFVDSPEESGTAAAHIFVEEMTKNPNLTLGFATGATARFLYHALIKEAQEGLSFEGAKCFNLDEYVGLEEDHPNSYSNEIQKYLYDKLDIGPQNIFKFNGAAQDLENEAARCERAISEAGGIDVQLVGIGQNAHLAFNEPGATAKSRTRIVSLSKSTRVANQRFFERGHVPFQAITMGIGTILEARHIVLIALGSAKADAVRAMFESSISSDYPATFLRNHSRVSLIIDKPAASKTSQLSTLLAQ